MHQQVCVKVKYTFFFNKQYCYKQRQAKIDKNIKQMPSNTLKLNFCYLKIIHILHPRYYPKIVGHILNNKQKNMCVCMREILTIIIIMKIKMKMKKRSHIYDINRPKSRHGHKYSKYKALIITMLICIMQHLSNI